MAIKVYKFGGASIATPECMQALWSIIDEVQQELVIVVSAIGKVTNALEAVVEAVCSGQAGKAAALANIVAREHVVYAKAVLTGPYVFQAEGMLIEWSRQLNVCITSADVGRFDHTYDQIVSIGELMSSYIFVSYLQQQGLDVEWVDCRQIIRTDSTYREGKVDWEISRLQATEKIGSVLTKGKRVLTQGFIGSTFDQSTVTLGREGTDYSAAMMAAMLGAKDVTIWKDVEGLQNADPKQFPNTVSIEAISFHEVIEMAYYGAQVIHPKTIKPLQNHNIPLYVKCFANKELKGTVICNDVSNIFYPPLIVLKTNLLLLQLTSRNFSFITEENLSELYDIFHQLRIKISLIQNTAINFIACIDHVGEKVEELISILRNDYRVFRNENVSLLTIRHYTPEILFDLTRSKYILMEQKTRHTIQVVMK